MNKSIPGFHKQRRLIQKPTIESDTEDEMPVKRGRGRPRKIKKTPKKPVPR